jgi:hypothetical protein
VEKKMNPIDRIKIIKCFDQQDGIQFNSDDSIDLPGYPILNLDSVSRYFGNSHDDFELPFKIRNAYHILLLKDDNRNFNNLTILKSLKNFPDTCECISFSVAIKVKSLDGLGKVNRISNIDLIGAEKYKTKEDLLKEYPNLNIGRYIRFETWSYDGLVYNNIIHIQISFENFGEVK